jgi:hypothetical protein
VDANGQLIVGDPYTSEPGSADIFKGAIIKIDPLTGEQNAVTFGHGGFVNPRGVVVVPALQAKGS